tara:strand:- start:13271 stop:14809 length:1539 start_codon:yes stop_codon:yes gene_type:complete
MKKLSLLFFWIFICFQFLVGRDLESDQELALHHFMEAEFLVSQGNYALAILEFQEALELDPNASTIHVSIAEAYRRLGKNNRAESHLQIAIELNSEEKEAYELLGKLYTMQKRFSQAELLFKQLVELDPKNADYYYALADLSRIQKKWNDAIDYYIRSYEVNSYSLYGLEQALQLCLAINDFEKSEEVCTLLIEEVPENEKYLSTLRDLALYNNKFEKALLTIGKLEKINGVTVTSLLQKSALYEELKDSLNALEVVLIAHEKDSVNSNVLNRLSNIFLSNKEFEKSKFYNDILIQNFPDDPRGVINVAFYSIYQKLYEDAINTLLMHSEKFEKEFTIQYLLGTSYYQLKDYKNSENFLLKALNIFPESRNTKHNLALIYDNLGQWSKSDEIYLDLVTSDSNDAQAYNNYAYSLADRDVNFELALELAENAIRLAPKSAPYLDTIGWIYYKLNDYDTAIKYIKESLSIDSSNEIIKEHLDEVIKAKAMQNKKETVHKADIQDTSKSASQKSD